MGDNQGDLRKTVTETGTGRCIELSVGFPECRAVIRKRDGAIDDEFVFAAAELGGAKNGFMLGMGWFTVKDLSGMRRKYRLADSDAAELHNWYNSQAFEHIRDKARSHTEDARAEGRAALKEVSGVSELLELCEREWREGKPGYETSKKDSFFCIALAEDALYILHEPANDHSHPLFPTPIKRVGYDNCRFRRGSGDWGYSFGFFSGALIRGNWSYALCRLFLDEGELVLCGSKEHVRALGQRLAKR